LMKLNNIDLDKIAKTVDEVRRDTSKAVRRVEVSGEWVDEPSEYQFAATCLTESGRFRLEVDSPSFMGGNGSRPTPIHFCLVGIGSCFMSTFMGVATERGIRVRSAKIRASCSLDLRKPLGIGDATTVNNVSLELEVEADASREELEEVLRKALDRCPAIYSLRNPIEPTVRLLTGP